MVIADVPDITVIRREEIRYGRVHEVQELLGALGGLVLRSFHDGTFYIGDDVIGIGEDVSYALA